MANIFLDLPVGSPGASIDTSAMGADKSIVVGGSLGGGAVTIEISNDGGASFQAIWICTAPCKKVIPVAAQFMRANGPASANADVGANDNGALFTTLPLPAGNGPGAPVDVSAFGNFTTFVVGGIFPGASVAVEVSEDGISYFVCSMFAGQGGEQSKIVVGNFMRTFVRGRSPLPFTATVGVGAENDATPGGISLDELVKVSADDTTPGYLEQKLVAGTNVSFATLNPGADEDLEINVSIPLQPDELVKVSADDTTPGYLEQKLVAGSGVAIATLNPGGDEDAEISVSGADADNIVTGVPIRVRGSLNEAGISLNLARADHDHRLELQVEDEGVLEGARPTINFVGIGVGAVDNPGQDRIDITIPGTPSDGTVVKRSLYVDDSSQTSSTVYVDGMAGGSVVVPIDGDYWAIWEGEGENQSAAAFLEVGISVNSLVAIDPDSGRRSQGNANDVRAFVTTVQLPGLLGGDVIRGLFRRGGPNGSVGVENRHLTIFKVQ